MKIEVKITTILMKLEGVWTLDTYCRMGNKLSDKTFVENFLKEYSGNGIEELKVVETENHTLYIDMIDEFNIIYQDLMEMIDNKKGNHTILNY